MTANHHNCLPASSICVHRPSFLVATLIPLLASAAVASVGATGRPAQPRRPQVAAYIRPEPPAIRPPLFPLLSSPLPLPRITVTAPHR